jgi:hypothetical protein
MKAILKEHFLGGKMHVHYHPEYEMIMWYDVIITVFFERTVKNVCTITCYVPYCISVSGEDPLPPSEDPIAVK